MSLIDKLNQDEKYKKVIKSLDDKTSKQVDEFIKEFLSKMDKSLATIKDMRKKAND